LWGNKQTPCEESYPGPYPFSEPETQAMRSMLTKYKDAIKFVYNFHAFGPMYVWPYNGLLKNALHEMNPDAEAIFNEIWDEAEFPESALHGNAISTVGYEADGEANDYIMHEFNIPSVSPELANDDVFSGDFIIKYDLVVRGILKDNYPWIFHTFKKMAGELEFDPLRNATFTTNGSTLRLSIDVKNIGLQDWNMKSEGGDHAWYNLGGKGWIPLAMPNIKARSSAHLTLDIDTTGLPKDLLMNKDGNVKLDIKYMQFPSDPNIKEDPENTPNAQLIFKPAPS